MTPHTHRFPFAVLVAALLALLVGAALLSPHSNEPPIDEEPDMGDEARR